MNSDKELEESIKHAAKRSMQKGHRGVLIDAMDALNHADQALKANHRGIEKIGLVRARVDKLIEAESNTCLWEDKGKLLHEAITSREGGQ